MSHSHSPLSWYVGMARKKEVDLSMKLKAESPTVVHHELLERSVPVHSVVNHSINSTSLHFDVDVLSLRVAI